MQVTRPQHKTFAAACAPTPPRGVRKTVVLCSMKQYQCALHDVGGWVRSAGSERCSARWNRTVFGTVKSNTSWRSGIERCVRRGGIEHCSAQWNRTLFGAVESNAVWRGGIEHCSAQWNRTLFGVVESNTVRWCGIEHCSVWWNRTLFGTLKSNAPMTTLLHSAAAEEVLRNVAAAR